LQFLLEAQVSISNVAPVASTGAAALTDAGIGSGLNVNAIVSQLMVVEAQPLTQLNRQISGYQATLSAYGAVSSALSTFQSAVQSLNTSTTFGALSVTPSNTSVLSGTAVSTAVAGNYNVNVTQLAQAQSLTTSGQASASAAIGTGAATTISFQFGTISADLKGAVLNSSVATGGIAAGSLTLNGTTISTSSATTSAAALAAQINLSNNATGVTAVPQNATSGVLTFAPVTTGSGDSYALTVGGVSVASIGASSSLSAAQLDSALQSTGVGSVGAALTAAGITVTGTAVAGTLQFTSANGANLSLSQTLTNTSGGSSGGIASLDTVGTVQTYLGSVELTSANPITVGGTAPSTAGLTAGSTQANGTYNNSAFTQDANNPGGTVTINNSNNSLQGIASAINAANVGVNATIINDGSSTPYRLVLTSTKSGAASSMRIAVSGDAALNSFLSNDPTGTQNLTQSVSAQSAALTVNGIAITSANSTVSGAIQGVTLNLSQLGSSSVSVAQNSSTAQTAVSALVSAYNALNATFTAATSYNATTLTAGPLIGDAGVQTIQEQIRAVLGGPIAGASQNLNSLAQLGITFQKDGSMALNNATLQSAISGNFSNVAALFSAVGTASDGFIKFGSSSAATKPGTYNVNITQLATQGTEVGNAAPGLTITSGSNDQLSVLVDGISTSVTLAAGTYTPTSLAAEVQSVINGTKAISSAGSSINVAINGSGALSITSQRFGSASKVSLGGDALGTLLGSTPTTTNGLDVAGTIGNNAAIGSGQVLTGATGSSTAGLALDVTGGVVGARGTVTFSQGYADQLNTLMTSLLGTNGPISVESKGLNNNIASINTQITALNQTLAAQRANYLAEFQALDTTISSLNATQTFLTQQLASLATNTGG
jgi:flagellar hook-associated protein 2